MPFLIKNIKPNRQPVVVRNEGTNYELKHTEQVVLNIRNITSEMFLQSMRGEITALYVGRMPIDSPLPKEREDDKTDNQESAQDGAKSTTKKTKTVNS